MKIFLPCDFGESTITQKGIKTLTGVTWFKWQDGLEITYFYKANGK